MSLLDCTRVTANVGGKEIILETGRIARQAAGAVWIQCEGTVCLTTVCETPLDTSAVKLADQAITKPLFPA